MKFAALFIAFACTVPISLLLRSTPGFPRLFWTVFGILPFMAASMPLFDVGLISWAGEWIGFVYGLELSLVDILAVAALLSFGPGRIPLWCKLPLLIYIGAAALSMLQAYEPLAASFGVWQFARMFLIMVVVARACLEPKTAIYIMQGMALGMAAHLVAVLQQRFGLGLSQAHGLFIHQNTLGMAAHMVLFPHLALLLYGYRGTRWQLLTVMATLLVVIFTASRASVGFSALGIMLLYAILALAGMTQRKMLFALSGAVALAIIAPVAISSFDKRFDEAPLTEDQYDERAAFNRAASFIVDDHPLGVGSNHYVHVAKNYGYSERAGVAPSEVNRNNIVHNAYWLAMAETGYPGIVAFCLMLIVPMVTALRTGWRERHNAEGNLLIGCGVALLIAYIHSMYEWVIFGKEVQYLLFTTMGMIFGISLRMNALRDAAPQVRNIAMPYRPQGGTAAAQGKLAGEGTW